MLVQAELGEVRLRPAALALVGSLCLCPFSCPQAYHPCISIPHVLQTPIGWHTLGIAIAPKLVPPITDHCNVLLHDVFRKSSHSRWRKLQKVIP